MKDKTLNSINMKKIIFIAIITLYILISQLLTSCKEGFAKHYKIKVEDNTVGVIHTGTLMYIKGDTVWVKICKDCDYGEYELDTSQFGRKAVIQ